MFIELVMPSNYLILCHPLLLLPSIFPSIRVFSSESALHFIDFLYCFCFNYIDFCPYLYCFFLLFALVFIVVQSLSHVRLFETPWTTARQASLSITNSQSLLMSIESVMPYNHLILRNPLLLLHLIFPFTRVFSNESVLRIRWPKYWNFSISISLPMNIQD